MASYPPPPSYMTPEWAQFLEADIVRAPTSASSSQNPPVHPCSRCPSPKLTVIIAPAVVLRRTAAGRWTGQSCKTCSPRGFGVLFTNRDADNPPAQLARQRNPRLRRVQAGAAVPLERASLIQYFNQSKSGRLDKSEVLRALNHAGFGHVDEGAVKAACQAFDPDRTNSLSLDQYIYDTVPLELQAGV